MAEGDLFNTATLLQACNPWWSASSRPGTGSTPPHRWRARLLAWVTAADAAAVHVLEGSRQTGKSTLLDILADDLIREGVPAGRICRWRLDDTPLRWSDPATLLDAWQALQPGRMSPGYLLIDDLHLWSAPQWAALAALRRHHALRLVVSTLPLPGQSPGDPAALAHQLAAADLAGRDDPSGPAGHPADGSATVAILRLGHLNFADVLALEGIAPALPAAPRSLRETFDWPRSQFTGMADALRTLGARFHDFLLRGTSLPANAAGAAVGDAHRALRTQLVERAIRVDGPALHGVRRVDDLMRTLDYLAARTGTLLDVPDLCAQLTVERPTVRHFLQLLEDLQLVRRIPPLGYGDTVQRARFLICACDPALPRALLWQDQLNALPEAALDAAVESAIHRHLAGAYGSRGAQVSFAPLGRHGTTLVVGSGQTLLPFAQHYGTAKTTARDLGSLVTFCQQHGIARAYVATRLAEDCGPLLTGAGGIAVMRLPAALLCLWLAAAEQPRLERLVSAPPAATQASRPSRSTKAMISASP